MLTKAYSLSYVFPLVMYWCERRTIKKAEHPRIDAFKLWCWRRLLRGPWTARRSNQSILKKINSEYSLEGLMLKLKLNTSANWWKELTHWKSPWCWERCFKRKALKHVYYLGWNRSSAQVGCMRQALGPGALGRPRGIGWSGRWEGGSGWGTHVNPWLFHFNVWQNPLQ